jgi:hypothetical protein
MRKSGGGGVMLGGTEVDTGVRSGDGGRREKATLAPCDDLSFCRVSLVSTFLFFVFRDPRKFKYKKETAKVEFRDRRGDTVATGCLGERHPATTGASSEPRRSFCNAGQLRSEKGIRGRACRAWLGYIAHFQRSRRLLPRCPTGQLMTSIHLHGARLAIRLERSCWCARQHGLLWRANHGK